jgi:hypothetical protein
MIIQMIKKVIAIKPINLLCIIHSIELKAKSLCGVSFYKNSRLLPGVEL